MKQISRRSFLRTAISAGAATAAGCVTVNFKQDYIDAHVHVWTPDTAKYPLASGMTKGGCVDSFTPEQLFAHCKHEGVDRIVLIQMSFYKFDNSYMLYAIAKHPGVFSGVAIVNEHETGVSQRMKDLAKQGVRGFRICAGKEKDLEKWLGSPGMAEMWKTAADEGLSICPLINPDTLPLIDKMCVKYPRTSVVIDHFSRVGMTGSILRTDLDQLLQLSKHPHVHVKTSAFYALGKKQAPYLDLGPMIRECRNHFGAQRLMWASDCPFQVVSGHNYHDSIALIRDRLDFLSVEDKEWMLRRTAEKVFWA
ncbi:MAG: amidohydrolase family protein [Kiritimatiellae bacterium]|nr:amidohydrolase family protein [Kiritimatiellia bacterium]MDD5519915.1 amidohydrolase family protein [Kiritimatiellia bacterium]